MKEILTRILKLIGEQQKASARLNADTLTLKRMISAMGPQFRSALEKDLEDSRGSVQTIVLHPQTMVLEALEKEVARMADDGCSTALANADLHADMYVKTKALEATAEVQTQNQRAAEAEAEERSKKFVPLSGPVNEAAAFLIPGGSPGC